MLAPGIPVKFSKDRTNNDAIIMRILVPGKSRMTS